MTIRKSIEFLAPYVAATFNRQTKDLAGISGLLSGSVSAYTATTVTPGPYAFIQDGLIISQDEDSSAVTVPNYSTYAGPVHIILSSPDSTEVTGVTITAAQGNDDISSSTIVLASRVNDIWTVSPTVSLQGLREQTMESRKDSAGQTPLKVSFREAEGVRVGPGTMNEADGSKRTFDPDNTNLDGYATDFDVNNVDPDFYRTNHVVLRKNKDLPNVPSEFFWAPGDTYSVGQYYPNNAGTADVSVDTNPGNTSPDVVDNAAGEHVVVWGNGVNLKLDRRAHTSARASVSTGTLGLASTVQDVSLATPPEQDSGDRVYGICSNGAEIVLFRTSADGASLDDYHTLTALANTGQKPKMVIDENRFAHIVFQHDESPGTNNQIYYIKYNLEGGDWGLVQAIAVQPRFARGANHGQNDTDPSIGIDNDGNLHIAFVRATGTATEGEIVHLVINQTGATVEAETVISGSLNDGAGTALATDLTDNAKPRVSVTPQGDVYIGFVRKISATHSELCMFERTMYDRTGFKSVRYHTLYGGASALVKSHSVFSDEMGRICTLVASQADANEFKFFKFAPVLCSDGRTILPDILSTDMRGDQYMGLVSAGTISGFDNDQSQGDIDRDGGLQIVDVYSNVVTHRRVSSQVYIGTNTAVDKGVHHPMDVHVADFATPPSSAAAIPEESCIITPSLQEAPFEVVGHNGKYGGYLGLQQAANALRGVGGRIIVRGGYHKIAPVWLPSGVEVVSYGHAVLDCVNFLQAAGQAVFNIVGYAAAISTVDATKNIFGFSSLLYYGVRPGDAVFLYDDTTGKPMDYATDFPAMTYVIRVIDDTNFVLRSDVSATITGMTTPKAIVLPVGNLISGVTIIGTGTLGLCIHAVQSFRTAIRDVHCDINSTPQVEIDGTYGCQIRGVTTTLASGALEQTNTNLVANYKTNSSIL